jgi:hypothetical protein
MAMETAAECAVDEHSARIQALRLQIPEVLLAAAEEERRGKLVEEDKRQQIFKETGYLIREPLPIQTQQWKAAVATKLSEADTLCRDLFDACAALESAAVRSLRAADSGSSTGTAVATRAIEGLLSALCTEVPLSALARKEGVVASIESVGSAVSWELRKDFHRHIAACIPQIRKVVSFQALLRLWWCWLLLAAKAMECDERLKSGAGTDIVGDEKEFSPDDQLSFIADTEGFWEVFNDLLDYCIDRDLTGLRVLASFSNILANNWGRLERRPTNIRPPKIRRNPSWSPATTALIFNVYADIELSRMGRKHWLNVVDLVPVLDVIKECKHPEAQRAAFRLLDATITSRSITEGDVAALLDRCMMVPVAEQMLWIKRGVDSRKDARDEKDRDWLATAKATLKHGFRALAACLSACQPQGPLSAAPGHTTRWWAQGSSPLFLVYFQAILASASCSCDGDDENYEAFKELMTEGLFWWRLCNGTRSLLVTNTGSKEHPSIPSILVEAVTSKKKPLKGLAGLANLCRGEKDVRHAAAIETFVRAGGLFLVALPQWKSSATSWEYLEKAVLSLGKDKLRKLHGDAAWKKRRQLVTAYRSLRKPLKTVVAPPSAVVVEEESKTDEGGSGSEVSEGGFEYQH